MTNTKFREFMNAQIIAIKQFAEDNKLSEDDATHAWIYKGHAKQFRDGWKKHAQHAKDISWRDDKYELMVLDSKYLTGESHE